MEDLKEKILFAVDLFSGGGGLSVGLKNAGFKVIASVENNKRAMDTYRVNHPETTCLQKDIRELSGKEILSISPSGQIDLLAGCPPCQGFTSLTSKYKRVDARNYLINEMLRLVEEIRPKVIMMENVPGLMSRGKNLLDPVISRLKDLGYISEYSVLQVADYGVPQFRRRFVLLAGLGFPIPLPKPTHSKKDDNLPSWKTVKQAIGGMPSPLTLSEAKKSFFFPTRDWHIVRDISTITKERLRVTKPGESWKEIPEELRPKCHKGGYLGFQNVYGRMKWDDVAPTITGGCTTFSSGRFGHPEEDRTISVREAARLQTFPDEYIFDTPFIEEACKIIGNALPCDFASTVARQCRLALEATVNSGI